MNLDSPVNALGVAFKMYAKRLAKLKIFNVSDLLLHIPFRYDDFSKVSNISRIKLGETTTIQGKVIDFKNIYTKNFKKIQEAKISDDSGVIDVIWFNQPFLTKVIHIGDMISLSGRPDWYNRKISFISPQYEIIYGGENSQKTTIHTGRLVPVYSETKGISSKWLRRQIYKIIYENNDFLKEYIPYSIIKSQDLMGFKEAIEQIHFPYKLQNATKAKERLSFDEVFLALLSSAIRKNTWQKTLKGTPFLFEQFKNRISEFWEKLPFELTSAQLKTVHEIINDVSKDIPMNRLLQGDVGSGKTVVATIIMYLAFLNKFQSILMAPTQILAEQHYKTIKELLSPFGISVELITASIKPKKHFDILIGTHAVLSDKTRFENLGLVVIDEQQRFGVAQRAIIRKKGANPHVLTMTATPIPRTIALTMYGDLDLSTLDEMPKGRKIVKTWLVPNKKRGNGYKWIEKQLKENNSQGFIVCPFIEESENISTVKAAIKEFENLKKNVFPDLQLGLLHGKMRAKEKSKVLFDFKERKIDILVATPVVEVGIDFPNASIIVIEAAERFGLAQLHQLRGRVGRGEKKSYCLLFTESLNLKTKERLSFLESAHNGADLAELDLRLRGPGEVYGTMQSGLKGFKIASFSNLLLIEKARKEIAKILPKVNKYPVLLDKLEKNIRQEVSPD